MMPRTLRLLVVMAALLSAPAWARLELVAGNAAPEADAATPHPAAPAFDLPLLDGGQVKRAELAGSVVLVDFWASWCTPCRHSLPDYDALDAKLKPRGFRVLAVNLDEEVDDARGFLKEHPLKLAIARDPEGKTAEAFGLRGMPTSYLLGCDGTVRETHTGYQPSDLAKLEASVEKLLGEASCHAPQ